MDCPGGDDQASEVPALQGPCLLSELGRERALPGGVYSLTWRTDQNTRRFP